MAKLPINPQITAMCDAGKVETITLQEMPEFLSAFLKALPALIPPM
jgi:hypothetical protein